MYQAMSKTHALNAANRHMETKKRRRRMHQILSLVRDYANEWFAGWWMA